MSKHPVSLRICGTCGAEFTVDSRSRTNQCAEHRKHNGPIRYYRKSTNPGKRKCLCCDKEFLSRDVKSNRLCPICDRARYDTATLADSYGGSLPRTWGGGNFS